MASDKYTFVIAFYCADHNTIYPVRHAAENVNKPVLVMLYPEHHTLNRWIDPKGFAAAIKDVTAMAKPPVGMHLKHCYDFNYLFRAMRSGFSCIMYECSGTHKKKRCGQPLAVRFLVFTYARTP